MICSFKDKDTAAVFARTFVKRFSGMEQSAYMRLARLDAAQTLADHLETLKGNRKGQHSIRVNDQWRICFHWVEGKGPHDVEIVDYH
jgi:toxin HigB-1